MISSWSTTRACPSVSNGAPSGSARTLLAASPGRSLLPTRFHSSASDASTLIALGFKANAFRRPYNVRSNPWGGSANHGADSNFAPVTASPGMGVAECTSSTPAKTALSTTGSRMMKAKFLPRRVGLAMGAIGRPVPKQAILVQRTHVLYSRLSLRRNVSRMKMSIHNLPYDYWRSIVVVQRGIDK